MSYLRHTLAAIETAIHAVVRFLGWLSALGLVMMVTILCTEVVGRSFLNRPFLGAFELTELSMVVVSFCGIAYTTWLGQHITIGILVSRWRESRQNLTDILTSLIAIAFWGVVTWQLARQGWMGVSVPNMRDNTEILHFPVWPFYFLASACAGFIALETFTKVLHKIGRLSVKEEA
ncbi:MAG: TRAP transporter small permease [Chloroflexota bacterium]